MKPEGGDHELGGAPARRLKVSWTRLARKETWHDRQQVGSTLGVVETHGVDIPSLRCSTSVHGELNMDHPEPFKRRSRDRRHRVSGRSVVGHGNDRPRLGAGKVRHVHCPAVRLQLAMARRPLDIRKRPGKDLTPDVGSIPTV